MQPRLVGDAAVLLDFLLEHDLVPEGWGISLTKSCNEDPLFHRWVVWTAYQVSLLDQISRDLPADILGWIRMERDDHAFHRIVLANNSDSSFYQNRVCHALVHPETAAATTLLLMADLWTINTKTHWSANCDTAAASLEMLYHLLDWLPEFQ